MDLLNWLFIFFFIYVSYFIAALMSGTCLEYDEYSISVCYRIAVSVVAKIFEIFTFASFILLPRSETQEGLLKLKYAFGDIYKYMYTSHILQSLISQSSSFNSRNKC